MYFYANRAPVFTINEQQRVYITVVQMQKADQTTMAKSSFKSNFTHCGQFINDTGENPIYTADADATQLSS